MSRKTSTLYSRRELQGLKIILSEFVNVQILIGTALNKSDFSSSGVTPSSDITIQNYVEGCDKSHSLCENHRGSNKEKT